MNQKDFVLFLLFFIVLMAWQGLYWLLVDSTTTWDQKIELISQAATVVDRINPKVGVSSSTCDEVGCAKDIVIEFVDNSWLLDLPTAMMNDIDILSCDVASFQSMMDIELIEAHRTGLMITDWCLPNVRMHQLQVLVSEFIDINFVESLQSSSSSSMHVMERGGSNGTPMIKVPENIVPYLEQLKVLESNYAAAVIVCRNRDATRGESIIPGYRGINSTAADIESDSTIKRALARSRYFQDAV